MFQRIAANLTAVLAMIAMPTPAYAVGTEPLSTCATATIALQPASDDNAGYYVDGWIRPCWNSTFTLFTVILYTPAGQLAGSTEQAFATNRYYAHRLFAPEARAGCVVAGRSSNRIACLAITRQTDGALTSQPISKTDPLVQTDDPPFELIPPPDPLCATCV